MRWTTAIAGSLLALVSGTGAAEVPQPPVPGSAGFVTLDFEPGSGGIPKLRVDTAGNAYWGYEYERTIHPGFADLKVTIFVTRQMAPFDIVDLQPFGVPGAYGHGTLSPFLDPISDAGFKVYIEPPTGYGVEQVEWDMGDFVGSDQDQWLSTSKTFESPESPEPAPTMSTYPTLIDYTFEGAFGTKHVRIRRTHSIEWFTITAGSAQFPNSVFIDNMVFALSPVPATGGFAGGIDEPESDPTGGGSGANLASSAGGPGTPPTFFLDWLRKSVETALIDEGARTSLLAKVDAAIASVARANAQATRAQLAAFVNEVNARYGDLSSLHPLYGRVQAWLSIGY